MELYKRFKKHRMGLVGVVVLVILGVVGIFAPYLAPQDPYKMDFGNALSTPSFAHPLGTDHMGRDLLSRVIYGARISLVVGLGSVVLAAIIGGMAGLFAGYFGRAIDAVIMRVLDVVWAFPPVLLALALVAVWGSSLVTLIFSIGVVSIPQYARIVRSSVLSVKEKEYILAATASGIGRVRIMFTHVLPNVLAPLIVVATLGIATSVMIEAILSFLGLGLQPPASSWGLMISEGQKYIRTFPYYSIFPGVMIMITVFAFNAFGDGLRDAWDPKLKT
jgi:ABC-type dipeptide/oligopeptide/nickel transport system permease subunit